MDPDRLKEVALAGHLRISLNHEQVAVEGTDPVLPSCFAIGEVAALALAEVGDAAAALSRQAGGEPGRVTTSVREGAQTIISFALMRVNGEALARTNQSNPYVRSYPCADGRWVFIHGGFAKLQRGLADLLELPFDADFAAVAAVCRKWNAQDLEDAIAERRLCGAMFRTADEWNNHSQGEIVNRLDTVHADNTESEWSGWEPTNPTRPLAGLRVLDLTRVLAGPTCGRTLAALGADVLQVTGAETPFVPAFMIDTGQGKRRAFCDLKSADDLATLRRLAVDAHVVVQGYRPGVVDRFGLDAASLRLAGFGGVYASVSCFGPSGPMSDRAGWEQISQTVSGIAVAEGSMDAPALLPAAAADYTTGLRMASEIMRSLEAATARNLHGSLCQTAAWILRSGSGIDPATATGIGSPKQEDVESDLGELRRLLLGVRVQGVDTSWRSGSSEFGSSSLTW